MSLGPIGAQGDRHQRATDESDEACSEPAQEGPARGALCQADRSGLDGSFDHQLARL
jgi:hypothetical protein